MFSELGELNYGQTIRERLVVGTLVLRPLAITSALSLALDFSGRLGCVVDAKGEDHETVKG